MGRAILIRVRELEFSCGNILSGIGDCSGSLESVGCLTVLGIRSCFFRLGDCLGVFFLGVPFIYGTYVLVLLFYRTLFVLCRVSVINKICHSKKKKKQT
jgi:hypothetical protein